MPNPLDNPRDDHHDPIDGEQLVDRNKRFSPQCLAAVREFRRAKPWRGTLAERQAKFEALHAALCDAYGLVPAPPLQFARLGAAGPDQMGDGGYTRELGVVVAGRLSVATYLWAFARARGMATEDAFRWSLSLFSRMFPRSFAECRFVGPYLVRENNQHL